MTSRQKRRLRLAGGIALGVALAVGFALSAFEQNLLFFLTPSQVAAGEAPAGGRLFRVGGVVAKNSEQKDGLLTRFEITDFANSIAVEYTGVLPDLFREGQGVVARGGMEGGVFVAQEVLAKHDENYMPPEAKHALDAAKTLQGGGY